MKYAHYAISSGRVWGTYEHEFPPDADWFAGDLTAIAVEAAVDPATHYVSGSPPAVTARPPNPASFDKLAITANGTDQAALSGIPSGTVVTIIDDNGERRLTITDGTLNITATSAQAISVALRLFPYLDASFTVTAS